MTAPRWEECAQSWRDEVRRRVARMGDEYRELAEHATICPSQWIAMADVCDAALARLAEPAQSSAEEEQVVKVLHTYGTHLMACDRVSRDGGVPCTCGLDALRSGASTSEPAQPTAAERWRAVPAEARSGLCDTLADQAESLERAMGSDIGGTPWRVHAAATRALLALARDAEGGVM